MNFNTLASGLRRSIRPRAKVLWTSDWVCKSCRTSRLAALRYSSTTSSRTEKPYYITTPIFYVNADPHVGHLYTMVLTDILKRWQVLKGREAYLCTGTDEHGMKIEQAAEAAGEDPKDFCDQVSETFKLLAARANLSYDHFIRTTDKDHKDAVEHFWWLLQERGYIYEKKHEGWYSVSDETFYPESAIEKRLDPVTGSTFMASRETGKAVEWTTEKNYHFRLSALKEKLLDFYKQNPGFIVPWSRMRDVERWVGEGLEDLSISRPINRLTWGIRVPQDDSQTIYVWLDALVNYITKAGFPNNKSFYDGTTGWPADVHVVGKDIIRFHCIYWPAFLLALDFPPPRQVLAHAHWTLGREKMAKSTGNVVDPFFALDRFGVDVMRFYLAHDGGISDDADYANGNIVARYKKHLSGGLGNLVHRLVGPKGWSVRAAVEAAAAGTFGSEEHPVEFLPQLSEDVDRDFVDLNPRLGLHKIMGVIFATNKYLQQVEPWNVAREGTPESEIEVKRIIFHASEAVRIAAILLQPYMPTKASEILDILGVEKEKRGFADAKVGVDTSYGTPMVPYGREKGRGSSVTLFPPLGVE